VTYEVIVGRWRDFYIVAGTSGATLVGLLFVGLSLHLQIVVTHPEIRALARNTLANLGLILFLSLFLVIHQGPTPAGDELIVSGAFTLLSVAASLVAAVRNRLRVPNPILLSARYLLSVVAYAGAIVAGALISANAANAALNLLLATVIVLIVVSLRNSWDLLVAVGDVGEELH
jgi:hypothetical protein